jgi:hypothetical protein
MRIATRSSHRQEQFTGPRYRLWFVAESHRGSAIEDDGQRLRTVVAITACPALAKPQPDSQVEPMQVVPGAPPGVVVELAAGSTA